MKRHKRIPKEEYDRLQKFKREVRAKRSGKHIRDHSGRIYKINENGMLVKLSIEEALELTNGQKRIAS